jgi:hypothetical protein
MTFLPKGDKHTIVCHVLIPAGTNTSTEVFSTYHNVPLVDFYGISKHYMFARFAWSIFKLGSCADFIKNRTESIKVLLKGDVFQKTAQELNPKWGPAHGKRPSQSASKKKETISAKDDAEETDDSSEEETEGQVSEMTCGWLSQQQEIKTYDPLPEQGEPHEYDNISSPSALRQLENILSTSFEKAVASQSRFSSLAGDWTEISQHQPPVPKLLRRRIDDWTKVPQGHSPVKVFLRTESRQGRADDHINISQRQRLLEYPRRRLTRSQSPVKVFPAIEPYRGQADDLIKISQRQRFVD